MTKNLRNFKHLIELLDKQDKLEHIDLDDWAALEAVRGNNFAAKDLTEDKPIRGGNIEAYNKVKGEDCSARCFEFTLCKKTSIMPKDFIAL